jgi:outer membrane protein OmpA-like peptidoglycan-associated protein
MRKIGLVLLISLASILISHAQFRIAIIAGGQQSKVIEANTLPVQDSLKNSYSARAGTHFGFIANLPFGANSKLSFQPGVIYYNKGRKYLQRFDTATTHLINKSSTQYVNYIDVPLNLVLKFGNKAKFIIGGGPYSSFFYNGKETSQTISVTGISAEDKNDDLSVGNIPGKYRVLNYGVNALAGFESGRVFLTANYSRGLNDFYRAINDTGSFKHQVIGITLGIFLAKPVDLEKKIKDKDKDGINDNEDNCPNEPGTAATKGCPDKDSDGIADKDDQCPNIPGTVRNKGCPVLDKDNDGINDSEDKCPDIAGTKKYNGCPVPDTDNDGINDEDDKCPAIPGYGRYDGCPVPDTDGDGVNDEDDNCPTMKGTKENNGCPPAAIKKEIVEKVNFAARRIQFQFSKADLLPESFKVLDEVVKILKENPELKLSIEGHTSSDGIFEVNMKLSEARANNVKAYLLSKGVEMSRLTAKGFGPTQLINNGTTEAAKSQNRRVELKLNN